MEERQKILEASHANLVNSISTLNDSLEKLGNETNRKIESLNSMVTEQFKIVKTMFVGRLDRITEDIASLRMSGASFNNSIKIWFSTVLISIVSAIGVYLAFK